MSAPEVIADLRTYVVWSETTEFPSLHALRPSDAISLLAEHDRLTEEVARLREALTPFAEIADWYEGHVIGDDRVLLSVVGRTTVKMTLGQCRTARAALRKETT